MKNKLLCFSEYESLYESYGFIKESEKVEIPTFTPSNLEITSEELISIFESYGINEKEDVNTLKVIKKGESGTDRVKELQKELGLKVTGVFDDAMENKVKEFQKKNKLLVDGKVGVQTLTKLLTDKGVKDPQKIIETKYILVKTKNDAKNSGIDPILLTIYDITIVNDGKKEYVICIPKPDTKKNLETLINKGSGYEWIRVGLNNIGNALVFTATGLAILQIETAKAIIAGIVSITKFITGGAAYVLGASVQGVTLIGKWIKEKGKDLYTKGTIAANDLWKGICNSVAWLSGKAKDGVAVLAAFLKGVLSVAKKIGYTLTGMAITTWKGLENLISPVAFKIVKGAKDTQAFLKSSGEWIAKNFKNGAKAFSDTLNKGWESAKQNANSAYNSSKKYLTNKGSEIVKSSKDAAESTLKFFDDMYNNGKEFWESEAHELFGSELFESEGLVWEPVIFSLGD